jgi:hypothetical protein
MGQSCMICQNQKSLNVRTTFKKDERQAFSTNYSFYRLNTLFYTLAKYFQKGLLFLIKRLLLFKI